MISPSFFDEAVKLSASKANFAGSKTRAGRRPMRVSTMLKKDKNGSLFTQKLASQRGVDEKDAGSPLPKPKASVPRLKGLYVDEDEAALEKGAKAASELLANLAKKKGLDPKNIGAIKQVEHIAGAGHRGRAAEIAKSVRGYLKTAEAEKAFSKLASEMPYAGVSRTLNVQNQVTPPTMAKRKPGDMPSADEVDSHSPSRYNAGHSPPETKIARALRSALEDEGAGEPGDAPDRHTPNPNKMNHGLQRSFYIGNAPDPRPITEVESDGAYSRN